MAFEIRPPAAEELADFQRTFSAAFSETVPERQLPRHLRLLGAQENLAAFDDGRVVGTAGSFPMDLSLPGGTVAPVAAVNYVGVAPTHRRRGALRQLMGDQLTWAHSQGVALAVLTASEGGIYGRFGYGPATFSAWRVIRERHRPLQRPTPAGPAGPPSGPLRLIDPVGQRDVLRAVYEQYWRAQPGELSRTDQWWEFSYDPDGPPREGSFAVVHDGPEGPDGYALYHVDRDWRQGVARNRLVVDEIVAGEGVVEATLAEWLFGVDLTESVYLEKRPFDDPLRWLLGDPRTLETRFIRDWLWLRLLDIPVALRTRRYRSEGSIVVEVTDDEHCPWNTGTWELTAGPDGAECRRSRRSAELLVRASELGSVYLGGVSFGSLARAGRVGEARSGAAAAADRLMGADRPPYCSTPF